MSVGSTGARFGPFEVVSRVGIGGMGEVFRARRDGREIALKVLLPELAREERYREMFATEARVGELLEHPNIVRLYDFGEVDGALYLAMELVEGVPLSKLLDERWPVEMVAHVALEVLAALEHAHRLQVDGRPLGIIHRDVSPANVLVGVDGRSRLADFGVAKVVGRSLTITGEVKGKLGYLAPEQLDIRSGRTLDARADLFSTGVVLYKLANGCAPFDDVIEWLRRGGAVAADGPLGLVIARALQPDPEARFASARDMARAIAKVVTPSSDAPAWIREKVRARMGRETALAPLDRVIIAAFASTGEEPSRSTLVNAAPPVDEAPPVPKRRRVPWPALGVFAATALLVVGMAVAGGWRPWRRAAPVTQPPAPVVAAAPPAEAPVVEPTPSPSPSPLPVIATAPVVVTPSRARAASPPPRHAAPVEPGYLSLDTEPWSSAFLGGKRIGTTPFARVPLPPGKHRLELDVANTGKRRTVVVTVKPGRETRKVLRLQ